MKQIKKVTLASLAVAGVALAAPVAAYADTTTTTISSTIGSTISLLTSSGTVNLNTNPTGAGAQTTAKDVVTVSTNDTDGFTLQLNETAASSALVDGGNSIPATSGTYAAPAALTANTWGYRIDGVGSFGAGPTTEEANAAIGSATYAAVPATASPQTLKSTSTTATNNATNVLYSVAVNTATPSGTYTNSVTYTATVNP